jgi:hypothetical protein
MARDAKQTRFVLLAPARRMPPGVFHNTQSDHQRYRSLLAGVQRFRGSVYRADGAIPASALTADGRHKSSADDRSWHLVSLDENGQVCACLRYLEESHSSGFDGLLVRHAAVSNSPAGLQFRHAVEGERARAWRLGLRFGEVGGWAVDEKRRRTCESIRIILAMYGLLELLGGCIGVATATWRHQSAGILRRIGLTALECGGAELPPYFDPYYGCQMEVLRYDSRNPNPKYQEAVWEFASSLTAMPVVYAGGLRMAIHEVLGGFGLPAAEPSMASWAQPAI